ncbi:MAG TPA: hypothetical protein PLC76_12485 [Saprospiraceae bacterium]|jgi:hypothetical protein|nr:hypothetical protein [Saprospiraceae bacterium]HPB04553.1 hypothetical protein [Bacteroidaceae bacterium]MBX7179725.1 hypothetical protein [Saprospiraceae bacterium]MCB0589795.1 hypothetical protein [Saprospiraceae bacterium]MCO5282119.1 hypothetical protein [Saprospiraceae bacterium]
MKPDKPGQVVKFPTKPPYNLKVVKVSKQKIIPDLTRGVKGVETNVWLTIEEENGKEYTGTLFVN